MNFRGAKVNIIGHVTKKQVYLAWLQLQQLKLRKQTYFSAPGISIKSLPTGDIINIAGGKLSEERIITSEVEQLVEKPETTNPYIFIYVILSDGTEAAICNFVLTPYPDIDILSGRIVNGVIKSGFTVTSEGNNLQKQLNNEAPYVTTTSTEYDPPTYEPEGYNDCTSDYDFYTAEEVAQFEEINCVVSEVYEWIPYFSTMISIIDTSSVITPYDPQTEHYRGTIEEWVAEYEESGTWRVTNYSVLRTITAPPSVPFVVGSDPTVYTLYSGTITTYEIERERHVHIRDCVECPGDIMISRKIYNTAAGTMYAYTFYKGTTEKYYHYIYFDENYYSIVSSNYSAFYIIQKIIAF